eukprot:7071311-Prorocentrum_lima.AAC.1
MNARLKQLPTSKGANVGMVGQEAITWLQCKCLASWIWNKWKCPSQVLPQQFVQVGGHGCEVSAK